MRRELQKHSSSSEEDLSDFEPGLDARLPPQPTDFRDKQGVGEFLRLLEPPALFEELSSFGTPYDQFLEAGVNLDTMVYQGHGTRGAVFDIGANRIAKFTTDEDEALVAAVIRDEPVERVWRVFEVFRLSSEQQGAFREAYSLGKPNRIRTRQIWLVVGDHLFPLVGLDQWKAAVWFIKKHHGVKKTEQLTRPLLDGIMAEIEGYRNDRTVSGLWLDHAVWILEAMWELHERNIGFHDVHPGNIRMAPDGPRFVDLGYSSPPPGEKARVDVMETRIGARFLHRAGVGQYRFLYHEVPETVENGKTVTVSFRSYPGSPVGQQLRKALGRGPNWVSDADAERQVQYFLSLGWEESPESLL